MSIFKAEICGFYVLNIKEPRCLELVQENNEVNQFVIFTEWHSCYVRPNPSFGHAFMFRAGGGELG